MAEAADLRPPTGTAVIARHVWRYPPLAAGHHYPAGIDDGTGGQEGSPNKQKMSPFLSRATLLGGWR